MAVSYTHLDVYKRQDILHQSGAVQKALKEVDAIILENHLQTCTSDAIRAGRSEEAINEVMNIFKKKQ